VSVPPCRVVPLLLVLFTTALAQPGPLAVARVTRLLELSQTPRPQLWVAPGQTTWVLLDAPLNLEAMRGASPVAGLRRVEVSERRVALVLADGVEEGTRLEVTLWFADGQPAEGVTLVLEVDRVKAEREVELYRGELPAAALRRQVAALNAQVTVLSSQEVSLSSLVAAGLLGPAGVRCVDVKKKVKISAPRLAKGDAWLYVGTGRVVLEVTLTLAPGAPAWVPGAVTLTEAGHSEPLPVRGVRLLGGAALQPGNSTRLLVEWDTPLETSGLKYTLLIKEANGEREVKATQLQTHPDSTHSPPEKEGKP
jgi:uncharacterized protein (TIGR02268 family)